MDRNTFDWRGNHYTRASGEIVGYNSPVPGNMANIIRSVAVMAGPQMSQSAVWVGPRLLLSTLHISSWFNGPDKPTTQELEAIRTQGYEFRVENEISSQLLSDSSVKVRLCDFSIADDIGLFKLTENFPSRNEWVSPSFLIERDELHFRYITSQRPVACVGYNGRVNDNDVQLIKDAVVSQLQGQVNLNALQASHLQVLKDWIDY